MGRGLQKPGKDGEPAIDVPSLVRILPVTVILYTKFSDISIRRW